MIDTPAASGSVDVNRFRRLARTSWLAPLIAIALNLLLYAVRDASPVVGKVQALVGPALLLIGLGSGLIALAGMARAGRRGILVPAVIGTMMNLALIGLAAAPFLTRPRPTPLTPVVHASGSRVLRDEKLGVTLDVPAGFVDFPQGKELQRANYVFVKGDPADTELDLLLSVSALPGPLPRKNPHTNSIPPGANLARRSFNWRGIDVDGLVVHENLLGTPFTTYNIRLPTLPRALQISVAAPTSRRAELDQITAALLPSIDARSNW